MATVARCLASKSPSATGHRSTFVGSMRGNGYSSTIVMAGSKLPRGIMARAPNKLTHSRNCCLLGLDSLKPCVLSHCINALE